MRVPRICVLNLSLQSARVACNKKNNLLIQLLIILVLIICMPIMSMENITLMAKKDVESKHAMAKQTAQMVDKPRKISFTDSPGLMAAMIAAEPSITVASSPRGEWPSTSPRRDQIRPSDRIKQEQNTASSNDANILASPKMNSTHNGGTQEAKDTVIQNMDELFQNLTQAQLRKEADMAVLDENVVAFNCAVGCIANENEKLLLLKAALMIRGENPEIVAVVIGLTCKLKNAHDKQNLWEMLKKMGTHSNIS